MNIYLAAQFKEQETMRIWRSVLHENNLFYVTSRWLDHTEELNSADATTKALIDLEDIDASDVVISYTLNRGDMFTGGGRHIEFGYAYARNKKLINIGGYESVFHSLPNVITVKSLQEAIEFLK